MGKVSLLDCTLRDGGYVNDWEYGAGSIKSIFSRIDELKNDRSPELTRCEQDWDYLNCKDAARAFLAVAENGIDGKFYPLGSGKGRKLSEYLEDIRRVVNPSVSLGFGKKEYYPHQPMHLVADIAELTKDTGWKPEIGFTEGISGI